MTCDELRKPLLLAGLLVAALGLAAELFHGLTHIHKYDEIVYLFSLSFEKNLPTWYSTILLFSCGMGLWRCGTFASERRGQWRLMAIGLFLASLDESVELHENLAGLVAGDGLLYFNWVIPASVFMVVVGIVYWPFVRDLPTQTRRAFLSAGAVFLGGALAMELPLGYWTELYGTDNLGYGLIDWIEESMEITGASLFLLATIDHSQRFTLEGAGHIAKESP